MQQGAMRTLGVEIEKIEPGEVEFSMPYGLYWSSFALGDAAWLVRCADGDQPPSIRLLDEAIFRTRVAGVAL
jgi:hypothetical protein